VSPFPDARDSQWKQLGGPYLRFWFTRVGIQTEMVVYPREGHSIEERAHRIDLQNRVLAWYAKYLK